LSGTVERAELATAKDLIVSASDKFPGLQQAAGYLRAFVDRGEVGKQDAVDALYAAAQECRMCDTEKGKQDVTHVIGEALAGRDALGEPKMAKMAKIARHDHVGHFGHLAAQSRGSSDAVSAILEEEAPLQAESPRPLIRELPPADAFPVDALGDILGAATKGINDRVQAPLAICGQSTLGAATLAAQGHANVELPIGQVKPISSFFISVAATGERKSATDSEALWPIRKREAELREKYDQAIQEYENARIAWQKARDYAIKKAKGDCAAIMFALDAQGPPPTAPLSPMLTCPEPTLEGLCKHLASGQASIGIFSAEGGQFIGGHGMTPESILRTAAGFSSLWDGEVIKRVRAADGATILPGRRVALHLMAQPDVAGFMLSHPLLLNQGLLSRCLVTAPESSSGTRLWRTPSSGSDAAIRRYGRRILDMLETPLPLVPGKPNELLPRTLRLAPDAGKLWIGYADDIERQIGPDGALAAIRGLANKLPEHAARLAAVLALVSNIDSIEVSVDQMVAGIALANHYAAEALRLFEGNRINPELHHAQKLLAWLTGSWTEPRISLPDIYQQGPTSIRDKATATKLVKILEDHGHLQRIDGGAVVAGCHRREVWRIVTS
jgi:hypothetical protein